MRKTSHNRSPNQRTHRTTKKQGEIPPLKSKQQVTEKSHLHNWWRTRALGLHQETTEESGKHQELVLYTILHYLYQISFILLYGSVMA